MEKAPGNPYSDVSVRGSIEDGSHVELNCSLRNDLNIPIKSYSWTRYPALPQTAQKDENRLSITKFDNRLDNGLYTCRVGTDQSDYENTKLVASNEYLLGNNPFFKFSKSHEEDAVEVKCRPGTFGKKKNFLKNFLSIFFQNRYR